MDFVKKNARQILFGVVIGVIIASSVAVYATYTYFSKDVSYTRNGQTISVEEALNDLYENYYTKPNSFRYFKLIITKTRNTPADNALELSEWRFYDKNSNMFIYPNQVTITSDLSGTSNDESISKLIDNNSNTKYCTIGWGNKPNGRCTIKLDLGVNNSLNLTNYKYYTFFTGNGPENRDPATWYLYASNDDENYYLIDVKSDVSLTSSRNTICDYWEYNVWKVYS